MTRVALTGATGFVGAHLARKLLEDGHETHLLVRPGARSWRLDGLTDTTIHDADLTDLGAATNLLARIRPAWVFNLAAHGAYSSQRNVDEMWRSNVSVTVNLVRACQGIGVEAFIQAGTSSEYGFHTEPANEDSPLHPNSDYAVSKAAASLYCQYAGSELEVPTVVLRLYSVYGPWEEPSRLVPTLLTRGLEGRLPRLVQPGIARDFVYVQDVAEAFLMAARAAPSRPGSLYNVGSGRQTTVGELVALAQRLLQISEEPRWASMAAREWDSDVWVADPSRIHADLGWEAQTPLEEGLRLTAEWLRADTGRLAFYREQAAPAADES